jgi:hypothetical protein
VRERIVGFSDDWRRSVFKKFEEVNPTVSALI